MTEIQETQSVLKNNLTWAQIVAGSINRSRHQGTLEIEQSIKKNYLDEDLTRETIKTSSPNLSPHQQTSDRREIKGASASNPKEESLASSAESLETEKRGERESKRCTYCGKKNHNRELCWLLYPCLKPRRRCNWTEAKEKGGETVGPSASEQREKGRLLARVGANEGTEASSRLDRLESVLSKLTELWAEFLGQTGLISIETRNGPNKTESKPSSGNKTERKLENQSNTENNYNCENRCLSIGLSMKNVPQNCTKWVLDSGATDHMTGNLELLKNYRPIKDDHFFTIANNEKIRIKGWGMISILSKKFLQDVFYVENCNINLLSISKLSKDLNCEIIFKENNVVF